MRYLSLFSGIEAATVAWHPLGWQCVAVSEIEPFPCKVLAHHYPNVPNLGDVTKITEQQIAALGPIDIVVFGSPCQDLSVAGKRKGLLDANGDATRSGLFFTAVNIIHWARKHCGCRFALWENVPGAFSSNKGRDFASVVEWLAGLDDVEVPPKGWGNEGVAVGDEAMVEWATLDAQFFGVAQRRRRVFALADFGNWTNRPPILLEPEGLRGDSAPRRKAGEGIAATITGGAGDRGVDGEQIANGNYAIDVEVTGTLTAGFGKVGAPEVDAYTCIPTHEIIGTLNSAGGHAVSGNSIQDIGAGMLLPVAHTLRGEGFDVSEDGTGRGTPLVPVAFSSKDHGNDAMNDVSPTLRAMGHSGSHANGGGQVAIAFQSVDHGAEAAFDLSPTIRRHDPMAVAFEPGSIARNAGPRGESALAPTLRKDAGDNQPAVRIGMQVRRLTPTECERLQGFPDNYTDIKPNGKPTPDGPRYKALGNSMAVPVMHWIGKQIDIATAGFWG